ncbi:transcriptional regulator [Grimontia hollisae]|uniref:Transcriptional activator ToxR n=1 Tax=Grimontia hollisae CIP 101886 TaxID=675812 RepID=D0IBU6_GRIHO|nr:winged helix-turn-helix domain-containing protein [Grimontia hollisae]AMG29742.1 transcriptional regulator [Grimontia hollisae]EEY71364.1 transcriptional activator ToxR [Grimontia hollisae CIP 101886]STO43471.1 Transcriptional activator CadC [Grimontia hollisae]
MLNKSNRYLLGERFVFSPSDSSLIDLYENDDLIRLGSNECRVLMVLIEEPHAIVTRNRIHDFVWRKQGFEVDDSSLTQSISTLRKSLKDSTKSPMFVKTVPKRGYQVVCSVEVYNEQEVELPEPAASVIDETAAKKEPELLSDNTAQTLPLPDAVAEQTEPKVSTNATAPAKMPLGSWVALVLTLLVPLAFQIASNPNPKSEAFREILTIENVPVYIPVTNARISQWQPMVQRCVEKYIGFYGKERELEEVIVTGGQDNHISLNYIHSAKDADDNITYVLLTSQQGSDAICR